MSKPAGIVQKGNEAPSEFYERLCEAYSLYTPIEPEATGSQIVINLAFISQACPYIKRKLQKTERVLSMSSSQLIQIAGKLFWNRDMEIEKKYKKRYKDKQRRADQRFTILAAALGKSSEDFSTTKAKKRPLVSRSGQPSNRSQQRPRAPLQPNQCTCSGFGHWKNECPEGRRGNKPLPVAELTNIVTE